ncbi:hypothetical protein OAU08_04060 [Porticoccaceae bacterium]|nr:hypothetical protein [Porticoccaceae bacterium]
MNLLDNKNLKWRRYTEGDNFDYPVDYSDAVLDAREDGRLELLVKWEPNCYCHFHRHTADTTSLVLQGELRVTDIDLVSGQELERSATLPIKNLVMCIWNRQGQMARWYCSVFMILRQRENWLRL